MRTVTNIINHEMHRIVHKQGRDFVRQGYFEQACINRQVRTYIAYKERLSPTCAFDLLEGERNVRARPLSTSFLFVVV